MILHLQELGQPVHINRLANIDDWRDSETTDAEDIDQVEDTDDSDDDEDTLKISDIWDDVVDPDDDEPGGEAT